MINRKFISKIIPVLLTGMLLLPGILPVQTATAAAAKPAGRSSRDNPGKPTGLPESLHQPCE